MMDDKLELLQAAGWKIKSTEDFLQLSGEEAQLVALKLSQIDLAQRIKSCQSCIAKIEASDDL
jgi:ribosome-binding protein aMBF1 (putative translation factor)